MKKDLLKIAKKYPGNQIFEVETDKNETRLAVAYLTGEVSAKGAGKALKLKQGKHVHGRIAAILRRAYNQKLIKVKMA